MFDLEANEPKKPQAAWRLVFFFVGKDLVGALLVLLENTEAKFWEKLGLV